VRFSCAYRLLQSYRLFIDDDQPLWKRCADHQLAGAVLSICKLSLQLNRPAQDFISRLARLAPSGNKPGQREQAELAPQLAQYLDYFGRAGYQQVTAL
jgi:hypothetical protein